MMAASLSQFLTADLFFVREINHKMLKKAHRNARKHESSLIEKTPILEQHVLDNLDEEVGLLVHRCAELFS